VSANQFDAGRLWAGGLATASVAALVAVVGIVTARGLFDVPVLAPQGDGMWGNANTMTYALAAGAVALAATGLLQLLAATTPSSGRFFTWIMMLVTAIATVLPLTLDAGTASGVATAVLNLMIGIAILSMLNGVARAAARVEPEDGRA
jgi:hypothetical protein